MNPAGYLYKKVVPKPEWVKADSVIDIYSLSGCISENFADYIKCWEHNGYWLFNSPETIESLAQQEGIDLTGMTLFYYEVFEEEYDEKPKCWSLFAPEPSFITKVREPLQKQLEGFDVSTFMCHTSPECSPLSCNSLATGISVNRHCLFSSFEEAKRSLENGLFDNSEPGPFRIFGVYTITTRMI